MGRYSHRLSARPDLARASRDGETGTRIRRFDLYIRTDSQWITRQPVPLPARNAHNLNDFDAIFYFGTGDNLNAAQKKDLLAFVHDDGKGFVGAHTGDDAFFDSPEFAEMIGGWFDGHPWGVFDAPVIVEDRKFPAMRHLPERFTIRDEIYRTRFLARQVHVLARLDASKLDYTKPNITAKITISRSPGRKCMARAASFATFGHAGDIGRSARAEDLLEAIRWALQ